MYKQVLDPVGNSLGLTSLFAVLPLASLFILLGVVRMKAWWAALISLGVALVVALVVYGMPVGQGMNAALEGAAFGFFPIMWIVINALWIFNMTEATGSFAVLRRAFSNVSDDQRVQVVMIAFCFGALLEALAGFGTPVAICGSILVGLGFKPMKAAAVALVADTAPVAFGAIAIPITTLAEVTGLPKDDLSAMVGRQCPLLALVIPFVLIFMIDGTRGLRQAWPAALTAGAVFALVQFVSSNYISAELTDILASLASAGALLVLVSRWSPSEVARAEDINPDADLDEGPPPSRRETLLAFSPYAIVVVVLGICSLSGVMEQLDKVTQEFGWPGLHVVNPDGEPLTSLTFKGNFLTAAGTQLLVCGLIVMAVLKVKPARALAIYGETWKKLATAILTVCSVLALAYVMNLSGQTVTLGTWAAGAGGFFAFLSPIIGWFGTAVTGSDTSTNSLFGALQVTAAKNADLSPTLLAAANSSGGVLAKMVSPQNLAIGAAAVGLAGQEGHLFRKVIGWSVGLVLAMAVLVYLQSTALLSWMVP
jgi:lactate permease